MLYPTTFLLDAEPPRHTPPAPATSRQSEDNPGFADVLFILGPRVAWEKSKGAVAWLLVALCWGAGCSHTGFPQGLGWFHNTQPELSELRTSHSTCLPSSLIAGQEAMIPPHPACLLA